jgi:hypothetical protein
MSLKSAPDSMYVVTALSVGLRNAAPATNAMIHGASILSPTADVTLASFEGNEEGFPMAE